MWVPRLPSIQRSLGRLISGQCKFFISVPRYFVIWGSNKFESIISCFSSPEFLECRSISVSDFNFTPPSKSIFSLSQAIHTGYGYGLKNNPLRLNPSSSSVYFLPFHRFEVMENNKRSTEEALNGSTSSRQRLRHQEAASWGTPIASDQRADSAQPSGLSLAPIRL